MVNNKLNYSTAGVICEHLQMKESYISCYIPGMKAYLRQNKHLQAPRLVKRIEIELEQSETRRSDIRRVLMRFGIDQ